MPGISFTDAAETILREFGRKGPMHYREMTRMALEHGFISSKGFAPESVMVSEISGEIRRRLVRGLEPRFSAYGRGFYGLQEWESRDLKNQIYARNKGTKEALLERIKVIPFSDFEGMIGELLPCIGFKDAQVIEKVAGGRLDVRGVLTAANVIHPRFLIQIRQWTGQIHPPTIEDLRKRLEPGELGLFITTAEVSPAARREAARDQERPVFIMDGYDLVELFTENGIAVIKESTTIIRLSDERTGSAVERVATKKRAGVDQLSLPISLGSEGIEIFATYRGKVFKALYMNPDKILMDDQEYTSPTAAARALTEGRNRNGWVFWKYRETHSGNVCALDSLRSGRK